MKAIDILERRISESANILFFTGAGVSTESGIPDFRSPGTGIYSTMVSEDLFSISGFRSRPEVFYTTGFEFFRKFIDATPNAAHYGIARVQKLGKGGAVVTQNIDGLHQKAGSTDVIQLHGTTDTGSCLSCSKSFKMHDVLGRVSSGIVPPLCDCGGLIKPDVTFFGEMLPEGALDRSFKLAAEADLVIVVGSSLTVTPAAYVPERALMNKVPVIIINIMPTPFDNHAEAKIEMKAGDVFRMIGLAD